MFAVRTQTEQTSTVGLGTQPTDSQPGISGLLPTLSRRFSHLLKSLQSISGRTGEVDGCHGEVQDENICERNCFHFVALPAFHNSLHIFNLLEAQRSLGSH